MKIINSYDLIDTINLARDGLTFQNALKQNVKYTPLMASLGICLGITIHGLDFNKVLGQTILTTPVLYGTAVAISIVLIKYLLKQDPRLVVKEMAEITLKKLALKLCANDIETNYEMLMTATTIYQTDYKIKFNENKLPSIMQNKYILIPTCDTSEIKDTLILQEHKLFSNEYIISIKDPEVKKVLKLAHSHT